VEPAILTCRKFVKTTRVSDRNAAIAAYLLAFVCLVAAIYHIQLILPLLKHGIRTEAVVTEIAAGARGSKKAIYRYQTQTGADMRSRDIFQLYVIRLHKGDRVTVIYDSDDVTTVTADLGLWVWQGPAIFLFGFAFFTVMGIMILKFKAR
jgi:hypothetical protein